MSNLDYESMPFDTPLGHTSQRILSQRKMPQKMKYIPENNTAFLAKQMVRNKENSLKIDKNKEIQFQNTQKNPKILEKLNPDGVQLVIDQKMLDDKRDFEKKLKNLEEEEAKSKKKKTAKEKAAQEEEIEQEREQRQLKYKRMDHLKGKLKEKQQQQDSNSETTINNYFQSLKPEEQMQNVEEFQQEMQEVLKNKPVLLENQSILKPDKIKNIFDQAKLLTQPGMKASQLGGEGIGAKYNDDGKIVPSSIIGNPKWYENQQRRNMGVPVSTDNITIGSFSSKNIQRPLSSCPMYSPKTMLEKNTMGKSDSKTGGIAENNSKIIPIKGTRKFIVNTKDSAINKYLKQQQQQSQEENQKEKIIQAKQNYKENQNKLNKELIVIKNQNGDGEGLQEDEKFMITEEELQLCTIYEDELKNKLDEVQQRLEENKQNNQVYNKGILKFMHKGDQLQLTKEARILKKYEEDQKRMKNFIGKVSKKLGRSEQDSVYIQSNNFRSKLETATALEVIQPDIIKYGEKRYWYVKLRDFQTEDQKYDLQNNQAFQLEVIRRPKSALIKSNSEGLPPFTTFTSGQFFQQKLKSNIDNLKKIRHFDDREIDMLEVIGENKFQKEANCLVKDLNNQNSIKNYDSCAGNPPVDTQTRIQFQSNTEQQIQSQKKYYQLKSKTSKESISKENNSKDINSKNKNQGVESQNQDILGSQVSVPSQAEKYEHLNRYQKFDLQHKIQELQQQQEKLKGQYKEKKKYKLIRKVNQNEDEPVHQENILCSNWVKEEIRGSGGGIIKKFQLKV